MSASSPSPVPQGTLLVVFAFLLLAQGGVQACDIGYFALSSSYSDFCYPCSSNDPQISNLTANASSSGVCSRCASGGTPLKGGCRIMPLSGDGLLPTGTSGSSVGISADGNILAVGLPWANNDAGRVDIFRLQGGAWIKEASFSSYMTSQNKTSDLCKFGESISLAGSGEALLVGQPECTLTQNSVVSYGSAELWRRDSSSGAWGFETSMSMSNGGGYFFRGVGKSVLLSYDGDLVAVGSPTATRPSGFRYNGGLWHLEEVWKLLVDEKLDVSTDLGFVFCMVLCHAQIQ